MDREGKVEIGALRGYVMTLDVHHESILNAPPDPAEAVGYWRTLKGAKRTLSCPRITLNCGLGRLVAGDACRTQRRRNRQLIPNMKETHQPVACRTAVVQAIECQESTGLAAKE